MRPDLDAAIAGVAAGRARVGELSHRAHLLEVNLTHAERVPTRQREWLEEAERVLSGARSRSLPSGS